MLDSPHSGRPRTAKLLARSLEQSAMLAWAKRGDQRALQGAGVNVNAHFEPEAFEATDSSTLKFLMIILQCIAKVLSDGFVSRFYVINLLLEFLDNILIYFSSIIFVFCMRTR